MIKLKEPRSVLEAKKAFKVDAGSVYKEKRVNDVD